VNNTEIIGTWREEDSGLIACPVISSTIFVVLWDDENDDVDGPLYDKAGKYAADIQNFMAGFAPDKYPSHNLMDYFHLPGLAAAEASIRGKVQSAIPDVYADGEKLYGVLRLSMSADLTNGELELFQQQIARQYETGWGGELEANYIKTAYGDTIFVCLWHDDMDLYPAQILK
jgi:hypothetical protein